MKAKRMAWVMVLFGAMMVFAGMAFSQPNEKESRAAAAEVNDAAAAPSKGLSVQAVAALVGAALAFGFGAIGAGSAIGRVGSAAMGAIAEKPNLAGQALIFVALAEGIVVFGFITALMILQNV